MGGGHDQISHRNVPRTNPTLVPNAFFLEIALFSYRGLFFINL